MNPQTKTMNALVIGGSAGAIDALKEILPRLPIGLSPDKAFSVIITLHLLPRGQSLLATIFRARCPWPVKEAESTESIQPGVVYFAPNDYHLSIEADRTFSLSNEAPVMYSRPSIDIFFTSAASVYKTKLVGLLLSGANADGAAGFKDILRHGGRCLAQAPESAHFPEMPAAALAVSPDVVSLSPQEIVETLKSFS